MMMGSQFPCNPALLETRAVWRKVFFQTLKAHERLSKEREDTGRQPGQTACRSLLLAMGIGGRKKKQVLQLLPRAATRQTAHLH